MKQNMGEQPEERDAPTATQEDHLASENVTNKSDSKDLAESFPDSRSNKQVETSSENPSTYHNTFHSTNAMAPSTTIHEDEEEPPHETPPIIKFQTQNTRCQEASQLMMRSMHSFIKSIHSSLLPSAQHVDAAGCTFRSDLALLLGIKDYYETNRLRITEKDLDEAENYLEDVENADAFCSAHENTCMELMFGDMAEEAKIRCKRKADKIAKQTYKMSDMSLIKWIPKEISADIDLILQPPLRAMTEDGREERVIQRESHPLISRLVLPYHSKRELNRLYELRHLIQFEILQEYVEMNVARAYMRHFQKIHPQSKDFLWLYRLIDSILLREGNRTCSFVPKKQLTTRMERREEGE